jgi:hypothetical protein
VWTRTVNGRPLHFYLAGINNQNFLMRDKETGTWWQQITGKAIYGPLKGATLELVLSDELTFDEWRKEFPDGKVLAPVAKYTKEYDPNWEPETAKYPVVISFPGTELKSRDVVVGLETDGPGRAYPWDTLTKQSPIMDRVNGTPLLIAVGPDGKSFRVFVSRVDGKDTEFFLKGEADGDAPGDKKVETPVALPGPVPDAKSIATKMPAPAESKTPASPATTSSAAMPVATQDSRVTPAAVTAPVAAPPPVKPWILLDSATASEWNFQGCAISGPSTGKCLNRIPSLKDYWFDWRNYHPHTTVYKR